jgi:hypothetical protein
MRNQTIAALLVVGILAGAGVGYLAVYANERTVTSVSTSVTTSISAITIVSTEVQTTTTFAALSTEGICNNASSTLPSSTENYYFDATVNYTGHWVATATVHNGTSTVFAGCYVGNGQGYFLYQSSGLTNTSTITVAAMKEDEGGLVLRLTVDGNVNTTSASYGVTAVTALVVTACSTFCPLYIDAGGYSIWPTGAGPAVGMNAYVFNCIAAAASPDGCTQTVTVTEWPYPSYVINIRYPFTNSTTPASANCLTTPGIIVNESSGYARCIPITLTAFVVFEVDLPVT